MTSGWNTKILHVQANCLVWLGPRVVAVSISIETWHTTVCIITDDHVNSVRDPPAARYHAALISKWSVRKTKQLLNGRLWVCPTSPLLLSAGTIFLVQIFPCGKSNFLGASSLRCFCKCQWMAFWTEHNKVFFFFRFTPDIRMISTSYHGNQSQKKTINTIYCCFSKTMVIWYIATTVIKKKNGTDERLCKNNCCYYVILAMTMIMFR